MKIQIDPHTLQRAEERGTNEAEIIDVINHGIPAVAKKNRMSKRKAFPFEKERNGKFYEEKMVEAVYIIENDVIITVTAYVFYGKWSDK